MARAKLSAKKAFTKKHRGSNGRAPGAGGDVGGATEHAWVVGRFHLQ